MAHPVTRKASGIALFASLLATVAVVPRAAPQSQANDRAAQFNTIWQTVRDHFYDRHLNGLDWEAVVAKYRAKALAAPTKTDFKVVVNAMLDELRASHCGYFSDDDIEYYLLQSLFKNDMTGSQVEQIGVQGVYEPAGFLVHAILNDGPADRAGIKSGDRIIDANGRPFTTVGSFRDRADSTVDLTVERSGQGKITFAVTPTRANPQTAFLEATRRSVRTFDRDGRRIGYIHLWTMTSDQFRQALDQALTGRLANTDGLILDLRDGFGGHASRFTDVLFRPDVVWSQMGRTGGHEADHSGYAKPLVVLINSGTRSAKEWFAYEIKKTHRGTLVGTNTAGAFLGANGFAIPPDGYLELPVVDITLDGKRLEGVGVAPDVIAEPIAIYGPNDRQLERGLQVLLAKFKPEARAAKD